MPHCLHGTGEHICSFLTVGSVFHRSVGDALNPLARTCGRARRGYVPGMTTNTRLIETTPERVWEVLSDGWLYPLWVVGASRMRDVDPSWPIVGSKLHHSVGVWPALIDDSTSVLEVNPGHRIRLLARAWPAGTAEVVITLAPQGAGTLVTISEEPASGPATLIPRPVRGPSLKWRNSETLRRLAYIAERRDLPSS